MKKSLFLLCFLVLVSISAGYVGLAYLEHNTFFYSNLDALSDSEGPASYQCKRNLKADSSEQTFYCGTCDYIVGRGSINSVCFK